MEGNLIAIIVGLFFVLLGGFLTLRWSADFSTVFRGCVGVTLVFVGLLAVVIGYSEHKATKEFEAATSGSGSEPPPPPSEPAAPAEESTGA